MECDNCEVWYEKTKYQKEYCSKNECKKVYTPQLRCESAKRLGMDHQS